MEYNEYQVTIIVNVVAKNKENALTRALRDAGAGTFTDADVTQRGGKS